MHLMCLDYSSGLLSSSKPMYCIFMSALNALPYFISPHKAVTHQDAVILIGCCITPSRRPGTLVLPRVMHDSLEHCIIVQDAVTLQESLVLLRTLLFLRTWYGPPGWYFTPHDCITPHNFALNTGRLCFWTCNMIHTVNTHRDTILLKGSVSGERKWMNIWKFAFDKKSWAEVAWWVMNSEDHLCRVVERLDIWTWNRDR